MKVRYRLHPGYVISQNDSDHRHFVNALNLAHLYKVSLSECVTVDNSQGYSNLIDLKPKNSGVYTLPSPKTDHNAINERYRIRRSDPQNIVIEKFGVKNWRIISYHGNSASSLISGLFNVIMAECACADNKLSEQLEKLRLELVSGVAQVEKMIKEADLGN